MQYCVLDVRQLLYMNRYNFHISVLAANKTIQCAMGGFSTQRCFNALSCWAVHR